MGKVLLFPEGAIYFQGGTPWAEWRARNEPRRMIDRECRTAYGMSLAAWMRQWAAKKARPADTPEIPDNEPTLEFA